MKFECVSDWMIEAIKMNEVNVLVWGKDQAFMYMDLKQVEQLKRTCFSNGVLSFNQPLMEHSSLKEFDPLHEFKFLNGIAASLEFDLPFALGSSNRLWVATGVLSLNWVQLFKWSLSHHWNLIRHCKQSSLVKHFLWLFLW